MCVLYSVFHGCVFLDREEKTCYEKYLLAGLYFFEACSISAPLQHFRTKVAQQEMKPQLEKYENFTEKGKAKLAEICKVGAKVFDEKGYLVATLGDVAQAAGVTKGGIFHYFSRKEELLFLILYRYMDFTLQALKKKIEACNTPHERIYAFIHHHLGNYRDNQAESRLALLERTNLPAGYLEIMKGMEKEYREILRSLVKPLMKRRKGKEQKELLATYTLLGMVTLPYAWFDPEGKAKTKELGDLIYEIYVGGLENPKALKTD